MKNLSRMTKPMGPTRGPDASVGSKGIALAPPAYGMDVLDPAVSVPTFQRKSAPLMGANAAGGYFPNRTSLPEAWNVVQQKRASGQVVQRTVNEAIDYYNKNKSGGMKATKESEVDLNRLTKGQKSYYTRLRNQGVVKSRKVGSATGKKYRLDEPRQIRVRYSSSKARFSRSERKARHVKGKYSGYNYATVKVHLTRKVDNATSTVYITRSSSDATTHSEGAIILALRELMRTNQIDIQWVYTEREACGPDNHNCRGEKKLGDQLLFGKNVPIYYSIDWPDSKEKGGTATKSRKDGTKVLKRLDTQVGNSNSIHIYNNQVTPFHATEEMQLEDNGEVTSDDESEDETDVLGVEFGGARRDYRELS